MTKLESVLYALKCRAIDNPSTCNECPYYVAKWYCCNARSIMKDALELLKKQEPHVMTLEELHDDTIETVYYETKQGTFLVCIKEWSVISDNFINLIDIYDKYNGNILRDCNTYGILWRCWTSKPSEQQRKDTPWNDYISWEE